MVDQDENRRTFTLDHVSGSVERELSRGIPVIEALERLSNSSALKTENSTENECKENAKNISTELSDKTLVKKSSSGKKQSPPKPKRKSSKKLPSPQSNADAFVIEFFSSNTPKEPNASKFQFVNNKAEDVNFNNNETNAVNPEKDTKSMEHIVKLSDTSPLSKETVMENTDPLCQVSLGKDADLVPARDPESEELKTVSNSAPTRGRATWRPSGSVLDKISSLMDAAEDCGMSASDVLNQVTDLPCEAEGEIEETPQDEVEDEKAVTSQIAYLRMQLEEKRRHIEAEKHRAQTEWEDQRRRLGQTAFWYVIGKAQGIRTLEKELGPRCCTRTKFLFRSLISTINRGRLSPSFPINLHLPSLGRPQPTLHSLHPRLSPVPPMARSLRLVNIDFLITRLLEIWALIRT
ncbi:hypothetical protein OS493_014484 [Desmophyllum pertusum]|uniref:Uncharacterized protein n=1 Tax=Desmophyllum pertusum TaxID=174260 RepID=A0A9W9YPV0_9CNID|nr:hypothetical protein OS493_014484 [Desmophyllum pertusum]